MPTRATPTARSTRPAAEEATPTRRTDPARRDRIIDTALDVIATSGVAGTSHRRVAAAADVPLGSMTYHFAGMDELLREAFTRFADQGVEYFDRLMADARDPDEAKRAIIAYISEGGGGGNASHRSLVLTHELYTLAAREPAFRAITNGWMRRSRRALERHFDPATARLIDALIEGLTIHRALDTEPQEVATIADALDRITAQKDAPVDSRPRSRGAGGRGRSS